MEQNRTPTLRVHPNGHRARYQRGAFTLDVQRGANGRRYRAHVLEHEQTRAFHEHTEDCAERVALKRILGGDAAAAEQFLARLLAPVEGAAVARIVEG